MSLQLPQERKKEAWFTFMVADGCLAALVMLHMHADTVKYCVDILTF